MIGTFARLAILLACFGCAPQGTIPLSHAATERPAAPAAPPTAGMTEEQATAMAAAYQSLCLRSFPAGAALAAALKALDASELPPAEVASYLHADPGRAWRLLVDGVRYVLTVENPPFHTCALRRMTAAGLPNDHAYDAVIRTYAEAHGLAIKRLPKHVLPLSGGAELTAFSAVFAPPGAKTARETSLLLLTNYHGRLDPKAWPEMGGGPGVEVRMAHQIVAPFAIGAP